MESEVVGWDPLICSTCYLGWGGCMMIMVVQVVEFSRGRGIQNKKDFCIRERPLMTSHIRVGRGVQNSPKKGTL